MTNDYTGNGPANTIQARTVMLTDMMDEIVAVEAKTNDMTPNAAILRGTQEANVVELATADVDGLGAYSKTKGYPFGSADLSWKKYTLKHDRSRAFMLDNIDIMQSGGLASAGYMMGEFVRRKVIPEVDATRIAGVAKAVADRATAEAGNDLGNMVYSQNLTASNILTKLREGFDSILQNAGIEGGLTVYMDAKYRSVLQSSDEITNVRQVDGASESIGNIVSIVDGNTIKYVPSVRMKTAYDYLDGTTGGQESGGFKPASDAKSINFIVRAPDTCYGIVNTQSEKYIPKENNVLADADFMAMRIYHDVVVPYYTIEGLYVSVKETAPSSS